MIAELPVQRIGVVLDLLLPFRAVLFQHLASVVVGEHRLDARGDVPGIERDGTGRRDRGQVGVAQTLQHDRRLHILIELLDVGVREIVLAVVEREGALLHR